MNRNYFFFKFTFFYNLLKSVETLTKPIRAPQKVNPICPPRGCHGWGTRYWFALLLNFSLRSLCLKMQLSVSFGITQYWCVILFGSAPKLSGISYIPLISISCPHTLFNFSSLLSFLSFLVYKGNLENKNSDTALTCLVADVSSILSDESHHFCSVATIVI